MGLCSEEGWVIFSRGYFESQPGGQLKERRTGPAPSAAAAPSSPLSLAEAVGVSSNERGGRVPVWAGAGAAARLGAGCKPPSTSLPPAGFALHVFAQDLDSSTVFLIELFFAFEFAFLVLVDSVRSSLRSCASLKIICLVFTQPMPLTQDC